MTAIADYSTRTGDEVPRAANRLSPLPVDGEQLVKYLDLISNSNQTGISDLPGISERGIAEIRQANGKPYTKGVISFVIRNLTRLGFIVESNGSFRLRDVSLEFLNGNLKPISGKKGHEGVSELGHLFLQCMEGLGIEELDPYIADQMAFFFDVIRKGDADTKWTNSRLIVKSSDVANPIHGFLYRDMVSKAGVNRIASEYLKMLGFLGVISKEGNGWKLVADEEVQEFVRERLSSLRFEKYVEWVIRQMGAEHHLLYGNKKFFRSIGRYITYRYSAGIGKQAGLRNEVMSGVEGIRTSLESEYRSKKKGANRGRSARKYIEDLRGLIVESLKSRLPESEDHQKLRAALGAMSLHELETTAEADYGPDDLADILRSRGSGRYSRLTLKRIQHHEGPFSLPKTLKPHRWQSECVDNWVKGDQKSSRTPYTGVASAVTGTGKTVMALMAASRFVRDNPGAKVSVVVPSKVLMYQWAEESAKFLGLGPDEIGFVGDGFSDSFSDRRLIVWIVNSAVKNDRMQGEISSMVSESPHLLIADECHEYGGEKYRSFLDSRAEGRLAISATPPDQTTEGERHPVLKTMGAIFYRLGYRQAHSEDLISGFRLRYLGIDLTPEERSLYIRLSDEIRRLNRDLEEMFGPQLEGGNIVARLQSMIKAGDGNATIARFLAAIRERKEIVRTATHRDTASVAILQKMLAEREEDFTMLWFHEQINETRRLVSDNPGMKLKNEKETAEKEGFEEKARLIEKKMDTLKELEGWVMQNPLVRPGMYHSKFPNPWGPWMIEWFRNGHLNVMFSARALAQGFDMPGADVGNIRSSTSNVRQRIQTIGRMIRKKETGREAEIWILFVKDTTDERIFLKHDWEDELPEVEDVQTYWELNDFGDDVTRARPELKGGVEMLPQPERELTEEELQAIDVDGMACGEDYPDRRAILSTSSIVRVDEGGVMTVMDGGAPFALTFEPLLESARWVKENRGRGLIHVLENGHAVARSQVGRVVFLADIGLPEFQEAAKSSVEDGDDFDSFISAFRM